MALLMTRTDQLHLHVRIIEPDRLDKALANAFTDISRARFQKLIAEGHVVVDGKISTDDGLKLKAGQSVDISLPPPEPAEPQPEDIPLDVIHEDKHLIVINKPPGLVVHPAAGHASGTLVNALLAHCGQSLSGIGGVKRPGIVHRLDKDTSGLLVIAKNDKAHKALSEQFAAHGRDGNLQRTYIALVWGVPDRVKGTIATRLGRSTANRQKMAVTKSEVHSREAITHYEVAERFGEMASLIRCNLETGRTHQIRVHMAHIGHPVLEDATYGAGFKSAISRLSEPAKLALNTLNQQALHAETLGFRHPTSHKAMLFSAPPPKPFQQLLRELRKQSKVTSKS
jgi:23S rRNA pseudouridine1911/1915/1917 synthase